LAHAHALPQEAELSPNSLAAEFPLETGDRVDGRVGTLACVDSWIEDFRKDIARNDLPTMIIHGDDDRILPADATSRRQAKMIKNVKYVETNGGSHGIPWIRSERGPSSSRRHIGDEPRDGTSSTSPSARSLATAVSSSHAAGEDRFAC
jgi:pimeloyl-ACP methyl ester carboxylesterase